MGKYAQVAQQCRRDAMEMVHKAGKGHLGTSFSSMDIIVAIRSVMRGGDIFLSSKGHDAPAQYALLAAWGLLDPGWLNTLRTEGGLPGHPTVDVPGIVCNTGSLGMGLSKACGFVWAARLRVQDVMASGRTVREEASASRLTPASWRVFVLLGDGEMSEGQNYEAMLFAARYDMGEILAVVDANGFQQDGPADLDVSRIAQLFRACGWVCDIVSGDADELRKHMVLQGKMPRCLVVETRKGQGVSVMEADPVKWHQRSPNSGEYERALRELCGDGVHS